MITNPQRPLPTPTAISRPFWDGCRMGELLVQKCCDCGRLIFIPQPACYRCLSQNLEWVKGSGRGTVYSYTVVWRPQTPAFEVPYVIAIVDLEDGYQMLTNIVGIDPPQVRVGMPVEVDFWAASEEIVLPYFRPRTS